MPFENPQPGRYWGYQCVNCHEPIAIWPYAEGSERRGGEAFTLDCMNWNCRLQEVYPLTDIRVLELTSQSKDVMV